MFFHQLQFFFLINETCFNKPILYDIRFNWQKCFFYALIDIIKWKFVLLEFDTILLTLIFALIFFLLFLYFNVFLFFLINIISALSKCNLSKKRVSFYFTPTEQDIWICLKIHKFFLILREGFFIVLKNFFVELIMCAIFHI